MRKPIVAGNWKMHLTLSEARALVERLRTSCAASGLEVLVCPPFTAISAVRQVLEGSSIGLGAQDLHWEPKGAFTGEIAAPMLVDVGCRYVIVGHSERRAYFGETDETVARKRRAAISHNLIPIVCIGETLKEREGKKTFDILTRQLEGAFKGCGAGTCEQTVLAYEPVWAIGTGRNATPEQAQDAQGFIRDWLSRRFGRPAADAIRIQYGGSVNPQNALSLMQQPDVDGALVGGASLKADAFSAIVKACIEAKAVIK